MPRAEKEITIAAPIDKVFETIADYRSYPEFLPDMKAVRVHEVHEDGVKIVEFELELIMRISYTLRLQEDRPNAISWHLESAKMMSQNDGGWTLRETAEGHTHATYGLEVKLRGLIPKSVSTRLLGETLPDTLKLFKDRCEAVIS